MGHFGLNAESVALTTFDAIYIPSIWSGLPVDTDLVQPSEKFPLGHLPFSAFRCARKVLVAIRRRMVLPVMFSVVATKISMMSSRFGIELLGFRGSIQTR